MTGQWPLSTPTPREQPNTVDGGEDRHGDASEWMARQHSVDEGNYPVIADGRSNRDGGVSLVI